MRHDRRLILSLALLLAALVISACSSSSQSDSGVARVDKPQVSEPAIKSAGPSNPKSDTTARLSSTSDKTETNQTTADLTDEQITTNFTVCLRDHKTNIPDPELNADGSVDLGTLKESFDVGPKDNRSSKALEECLPLLAGATFSQGANEEDEIQLQDDLLAFVQCLRDEGINVPDPDFSGDPRAGMGAVKESLKGASGRVERSMNLCNENVFGAGKSTK